MATPHRVSGTAGFEWLEGKRFLLQRSRTDHIEFPDSLIVFAADDDGLSMNYFDSRGVHRIYHARMNVLGCRSSTRPAGYDAA